MGPKAHHTIPRIHLQNFVGSSPHGQVWTYDATTGKCWSQIPEETGIQTHFYSVGKDDGTHDTRIEEMLSGFESRAAPVYESLLRGDIPGTATQERVHFAEFLGIMFVRTSAMRRMYAEITSRRIQTLTFAYSQSPKAFARAIRAVEEERGEPIDAETKEEMRRAIAEPGDYEILIPKEKHLRR